MSRLQISRRPIVIGLLSLIALCVVMLSAYPVAASLRANNARQLRSQTFAPKKLREKIATHALAATVQVLASQAPSVIIQFPLFPSGVKAKFPDAKGVVTIVQGNPDISLVDTVTVDVQKMPPDTTFTIFFIELANKPFGHVEYTADLHTRSDGTGDSTFQTITLVAFAADAANPGTSKDQSGDASGIQLEHLGMWFAQLQDAQKILGNTALKGTPFDGGNAPLHAGPQALTDGQSAPVF